jgi:DNA-binding PadR family transcriptional regulator
MAVLSMLAEDPAHAYRLQQLIKERHKDDVVNVSQRNMIYQTIERLLRDGLIRVEATERAQRRPERTTYALTAAGRATLDEWMHAMLSTPAREFPEFPAALAFLPTISPAAALDALTIRAARLEQRLAEIDEELTQGATFLPRLFLVESELARRVIAAELEYVRGLVEDLRTQRLTWPWPIG